MRSSAGLAGGGAGRGGSGVERGWEERYEALAVDAAILELWKKTARRRVARADRPAVQAEAFGVTTLRNHHGLVVHPVARSAKRGQVRDQLWVRQHLTEDIAVWLGPEEHAAHVEPRACGRHRRVWLRVP